MCPVFIWKTVQPHLYPDECDYPSQCSRTFFQKELKIFFGRATARQSATTLSYQPKCNPKLKSGIKFEYKSDRTSPFSVTTSASTVLTTIIPWYSRRFLCAQARCTATLDVSLRAKVLIISSRKFRGLYLVTNPVRTYDSILQDLPNYGNLLPHIPASPLLVCKTSDMTQLILHQQRLCHTRSSPKSPPTCGKMEILLVPSSPESLPLACAMGRLARTDVPPTASSPSSSFLHGSASKTTPFLRHLASHLSQRKWWCIAFYHDAPPSSIVTHSPSAKSTLFNTGTPASHFIVSHGPFIDTANGTTAPFPTLHLCTMRPCW